MRVIFFDNGNTMCFDKDGHQRPELQESWLLLYVESLKKKGFNPLEFEFELPIGKAKIFKTNLGYNWEFIR